jgi:hypothetical protein
MIDDALSAIDIPAAYGALMDRSTNMAISRPLFLALLGAFTLSASDPAIARDYKPRDIGDWTVGPSKDGKGCFLTRDYPRNGGTTLLLGLDIDGTNRLSILNPNWSIKPKDRLKLNFRLSNSSYPDHFAIGIASDGKQGFVTSFGAKFPTLFAASDTLSISRGDVPVERLRLDGGDAAVTELGHCVDDQRDAPAASDNSKTRSDDIPKDPFSIVPKRVSKSSKSKHSASATN